MLRDSYATAHPGEVARLVLIEPGDPPDTRRFAPMWRRFGVCQRCSMSQTRRWRASHPAGLAPYAPADELRHWVLTGLKPLPDGRWTWRLDPVLQRPDPQGRERLTYGAE